MRTVAYCTKSDTPDLGTEQGLVVQAAGVLLSALLYTGSGTFGPCLVPKKFYKIFQIPCHIESLDTCMKH
jgi:hypothetical protein